MMVCLEEAVETEVFHRCIYFIDRLWKFGFGRRRVIDEHTGVTGLDYQITGSELASIMEVLPQALVNAKVPNHKKEKYMEYPEIAEAIQKLTDKFAGEGRVLIRPSGTEPKVRVMIEGKDQQMIEHDAKELADLIQNVML